MHYFTQRLLWYISWGFPNLYIQAPNLFEEQSSLFTFQLNTSNWVFHVLISNISKPEQPLSPRNQNLFLIILFSPMVPLFFQLSLLKTTNSFYSLSFLLTTSSWSPILINSYCSKCLLASIFAFFIASATFLKVTSPNLLQLVSMLSVRLTNACAGREDLP